MRGTSARFIGVVLTAGTVLGTAVRSQERGRADSPYVAAPGQVVAVRAGQQRPQPRGHPLKSHAILYRLEPRPSSLQSVQYGRFWQAKQQR